MAVFLIRKELRRINQIIAFRPQVELRWYTQITSSFFFLISLEIEDTTCG